MIDDPRYPVGRFTPKPEVTAQDRAQMVAAIRETPAAMRAAVRGLGDAQLDTPYRQGGWTVRQVVHHLPESHMNAYIRFKLALTEHNPTIKPYLENEWAKLPDAKGPIEPSLMLLDGLHQRWVAVLDTLAAEDYARGLQHPEHGQLTLDHLLQMYAWHGRHHVAHVTSLRSRSGW
jgi:uncharacterized damage-inducible protein DinB